MNESESLSALQVRKTISIFQALQSVGVKLLRSGTQQIVCPFHDDSKPSARAYEDTNKLFCFTCQKLWDPIQVVMDSKKLSFNEAVNYLEKTFNLPDPSSNLVLIVQSNLSARQSPNIHTLYSYVEAQLISARRKMGLKRYCKALSALDVIYLQATSGKLPLEAFKEAAHALLSYASRTV